MTVRTYGVENSRDGVAPENVHVSELCSRGFTVVPGTSSDEMIEGYRTSLDRLLADRENRAGGAKRLAEVGEAGLVRAPLAYDDCFLRIMADPAILSLCRTVLGSFCTLMQQNGISNSRAMPCDSQTRFHRDLPYQNFVSTPPIALSALYCLDDFTPERGSTIVVPGSHLESAYPGDARIERDAVPTDVPAGCYLLFDSMLFHRAGDNHTDKPRRAVNNVYTLPILKQQINLPAMLGGRWSDDDELAVLLGYQSVPSDSDEAWLESRFEKVRDQ